MPVTGRIIGQQKSLYRVDTQDGELTAALKGTLKIRRDKPCVGDRVILELEKTVTYDALITSILPRRNRLARPVIANVDQAMFIATIRQPAVEADSIDRFLVSMEAAEMATVLVFNKTDLLDTDGQKTLEHLCETYRNAGYAVTSIAARSREGIERIFDLCRGKVSTLAGISGVGKSTLINALIPGLEHVTSNLSVGADRGVHTTTTTALLKIAPDSYLADTPGFTSIVLPRIDERVLYQCFPELKALIGTCRFNNCLHRGEPGCRAVELLAQGGMARCRYDNYLKFFEELSGRQRVRYN